jgi:hypothetical protein
MMAVQSRELAPAGRPVAITLICMICAIGAVAAIPLIVVGAMRGISPRYPVFTALSIVNGLVCAVGFWFMRKWAVYLYAAVFVLGQLLLVVMGTWEFSALLVFPLAVVMTGFVYLSRMR